MPAQLHYNVELPKCTNDRHQKMLRQLDAQIIEMPWPLAVMQAGVVDVRVDFCCQSDDTTARTDKDADNRRNAPLGQATVMN